MKSALYIMFLFLMNISYSQNILEALKLKNDSLGESTAIGMLTDTLIDINNGYYEEYESVKEGQKTIIRQATLFNNKDGSKMLGVSETIWDYQCSFHKINFYTISKSKHIDEVTDALPQLSIEEFVKDTNVIHVIKKYLPQIKGNYLDSNATFKDVLLEFYDITYVLPQKGTNVVAVLKVCDYIPTNEVVISSSDWSVIEGAVTSIELLYDKCKKRFYKAKED